MTLVVGGLLCAALLAFVAFMTRRPGGRRRSAGAPIYRRNPSYRRHLRRDNDDADWGDSGDHGGSSDSGGFSCGGGGGGGD